MPALRSGNGGAAGDAVVLCRLLARNTGRGAKGPAVGEAGAH